MLRLFAGHPTAANLLMLALLALGLFSLPQLSRETFPEVKSYEVQVRIAYPGAGPEEVLQGICLPLENATNGISYLDEKRCDARANSGLMTLKMQQQGNFDDFLDDVRSAIDKIDNFPQRSKTPIISETGRTAPVVTLALTVSDPDFPASELKDLAELIKARMQQHPGIPLVELSGFSQRQLIVSVRPDKLRQYQISLQQIAAVLKKQNVDVPLGDLTSAGKNYELRFIDQQQTPQQLARLTLFSNAQGAEIHLGELADIYFGFEKEEQYVTFDNQRAALLRVLKNTEDDSLSVLQAVEEFTAGLHLPAGVKFSLTQDFTTIVNDRLKMLLSNAWQGLVLVFLTLLLFFGLRYSFWVIMGLPVSFLAAMFVLVQFGITINMMSMVALLLALGILMDDAIVIAESIASQRQAGQPPLQAVSRGVNKVARGVIASFLTTVCVFGAILGLEGNLGQVLRVVPLVLLIVISISLIEAFLILPAHLYHSLQHQSAQQNVNPLQQAVNQWFERQKNRLGVLLTTAIHYRYAVIGITLACFFISISLIASGILKFNALPEMDGDVLEARLIMPAGTPLASTEQQVDSILIALQQALHQLQPQEQQPLLRHTSVRFSDNADAFDNGPHLATISLDLLTADQRNTSIDQLISYWQQALPDMPYASQLILTEPSLGPAGRAIEIRLSGLARPQLAQASQQLQHWLKRYNGVYNILDDYRPGKPQISLHFKPQARALNIDAASVAEQLRSAYAGIVVDEVYRDIHPAFPGLLNSADNLEIVVQLNKQQSFDQLRDFPIQLQQANGKIQLIPLATLADIQWQRDVSRIHRINNRDTITVLGSVNKLQANTNEVMLDTQQQFLPQLLQQFPQLQIDIQGEMNNARETQQSLQSGLLLGLLGVFILLSFQFRSYAEPVIVMLSIPLALIGVVAGHLIMGQNLAMPSMVGFVSLAGIVVNNAILLVEFVKYHRRNGASLADAARQASQDRLRAIVLTTSTTVAGMLPLLFETSLQAQVLIPLVISISFGLLISTLLILIVLPCLYTILQDLQGTAVTTPEATQETADK